MSLTLSLLKKVVSQKMSHLLELPAELLQEILGWVDLEGLLTCALVCKVFRTAAREDTLWTRFLVPYWGGRGMESLKSPSDGGEDLQELMLRYGCSTALACCQIQCPLLFDYDGSKGPPVDLRTDLGAARAMAAVQYVTGQRGTSAYFERGTYETQMSMLTDPPLSHYAVRREAAIVCFRVGGCLKIYGDVRESTTWDGTFFGDACSDLSMRAYGFAIEQRTWKWGSIKDMHHKCTESPERRKFRVPMKRLRRSLFRH